MVLRGQICMDNQTKPTIIGMARLGFANVSSMTSYPGSYVHNSI
jgi:hypothetical protein